MSKADEMFEKLGYTNLKEYRSGMILHYIKSSDLSANESEHIVFYKNETIGFYYTYCNFKKDLDMQELQAINEKVKELGWNE